MCDMYNYFIHLIYTYRKNLNSYNLNLYFIEIILSLYFIKVARVSCKEKALFNVAGAVKFIFSKKK